MKDKLTFEQECSLIANGEDLPKEKQIDRSWKAKMVEKGLYKDSEITSKENQFKERIDCGIAYCEDTAIEEIKQDFKMHEENHKQVEEMAKALLEYIKVYGKLHLTVDGIDNTARLFAKFGITKLPKDSVVLSREELEEKYEPSEKFMAVARELEDLKQNLEDKIVLSMEEYEEYQSFKNGDYCATKCDIHEKGYKDMVSCGELEEQNEELNKSIKKLTSALQQDHEDRERFRARNEELKKQLEQVSKETAEKFYKKVRKLLKKVDIIVDGDEGLVGYEESAVDKGLTELAKQFGVEIKE